MLVRAHRRGGTPAVPGARRPAGGSDARCICARDIFRWVAAEVGARRILCLPRAVADCEYHGNHGGTAVSTIVVMAVAGPGAWARRRELDPRGRVRLHCRNL